MIHYELHVTTVMSTLVKYQYDLHSQRLAQKCYDQFRQYMEDEGNTVFSYETALEWCDLKAGKSSKIPFKAAIQRLADVYAYGRVLNEHIKFMGSLTEAWSQDLGEYLRILSLDASFSGNYQRNIKDICTQFCRFAQMNMVNSAQEMDYTVLERYHNYTESRYKSYTCVEGVVSKFLEHLSNCDKCRKVYSLFIHYIGMGKCTFLNDLSPQSREATECQREASRSFSSHQFYSSLPDFKEKLKSAGYSKRIQRSYSYYLTLLYLFLDRADLGYDKAIADIWLRDLGECLFGNESRKARRAIEMYEDYHRTGDVIPERWWKHSTTAYDMLPEWCKVEIQHFLAAKIKEGCSEDTTDGFKTHLASFCQFLVSEGVPALSDITPGIIKKYNTQDQHKTPEGKNLYNRHIRQFIIYLELKQSVPDGLHFALPSCATSGEKIVKVLGQDDREKINAYCKNASSPLELRDAAILKIGMTTALRGSDIVALKISDIDWKNRVIRIVQSKTKVEHSHPMEVGVGNAIFKYLRNGRCREADNDYLFIAIRAPYGPLHREACPKSMRRAGAIATDFHRLRRTYATDMLNAGATFIETAELLGHTDTHNVHKYTALDQERMRLCPLSLEETGLVLEGRYGHE